MTMPRPRRGRSTPPRALSLLFVDISLQRSATAEKRQQTLENTGCAMTMAAVMRSRAAAPAWPEASRIVRVDILSDLGEAEAVWRGLEQPDRLFTPYQRFDLLAAWQRRV